MTFKDNQECLDLVEGTKPSGILAMLDEEIRVPKGDDKSYLSKITKKFNKKHDYFVVKMKKRDQFAIRHFAGEVFYAVKGFMEKNKDQLSQLIVDTMKSSDNNLLFRLFNANHRRGSQALFKLQDTKKKKKKKKTLGGEFRHNLNALMDSINATHPNFVRCVKSNSAKKALGLEPSLVMRQLRYSGLFEAIRIRRAGYAYRMPHKQFFQQYFACAGMSPGTKKGKSDAEMKAINERLVARLLKDGDADLDGVDRTLALAIAGKTKTFVRNSFVRKVFEKLRARALQTSVVTLQRAARGMLMRRYAALLGRERAKLRAAVAAEDVDGLVATLAGVDPKATRLHEYAVASRCAVQWPLANGTAALVAATDARDPAALDAAIDRAAAVVAAPFPAPFADDQELVAMKEALNTALAQAKEKIITLPLETCQETLAGLLGKMGAGGSEEVRKQLRAAIADAQGRAAAVPAASLGDKAIGELHAALLGKIAEARRAVLAAEHGVVRDELEAAMASKSEAGLARSTERGRELAAAWTGGTADEVEAATDARSTAAFEALQSSLAKAEKLQAELQAEFARVRRERVELEASIKLQRAGRGFIARAAFRHMRQCCDELRGAIERRSRGDLEAWLRDAGARGMKCGEVSAAEAVLRRLTHVQGREQELTDACTGAVREDVIDAVIAEAAAGPPAAELTQVFGCEAWANELFRKGHADAILASLGSIAIDAAAVARGEAVKASLGQLRSAVTSEVLKDVESALAAAGRAGTEGSAEWTAAQQRLEKLRSEQATRDKLTAAADSEDLVEIDAALYEAKEYGIEACAEAERARTVMRKLKLCAEVRRQLVAAMTDSINGLASLEAACTRAEAEGLTDRIPEYASAVKSLSGARAVKKCKLALETTIADARRKPKDAEKRLRALIEEATALGITRDPDVVGLLDEAEALYERTQRAAGVLRGLKAAVASDDPDAIDSALAHAKRAGLYHVDGESSTDSDDDDDDDGDNRTWAAEIQLECEEARRTANATRVSAVKTAMADAMRNGDEEGLQKSIDDVAALGARFGMGEDETGAGTARASLRKLQLTRCVRQLRSGSAEHDKAAITAALKELDARKLEPVMSKEQRRVYKHAKSVCRKIVKAAGIRGELQKALRRGNAKALHGVLKLADDIGASHKGHSAEVQKLVREARRQVAHLDRCEQLYQSHGEHLARPALTVCIPYLFQYLPRALNYLHIALRFP